MIDLFLSVLSGSLLVMAFPKFNFYLLAYVALIPFFIAIKRSKTTYGIMPGAVFGAIFMSGYLYWVNVLSNWAGWWAYLAFSALIVYEVVFFIIFAACLKVIINKMNKYDVFLVPLLWVMVEWARALGPYGITGGVLGYSQADLLPILQLASFTGVYGISFFIVLINYLITKTIFEKNVKYIVFGSLLFLAVYFVGQVRVNSYAETGKPFKVSVIQASIPQDAKLDFDLASEMVTTHAILSKKSATFKPDLIIWPETAVTIYLFETKTMFADVRALIKSLPSYYLIGTPYREKGKIYNSMVLLSPSSEIAGRYDKQHLVPFGEYLPMRPFMYHLLRDNPLFSDDYNSNYEGNIIEVKGVKIGVVICFESTFSGIVRDKVKKGAKFIVVATNDAWFFNSAALYQHIQAARLRAVENGVYVVQAANTGISAIIDPIGRVVKYTSEGDVSVLNGTVYIH